MRTTRRGRVVAALLVGALVAGGASAATLLPDRAATPVAGAPSPSPSPPGPQDRGALLPPAVDGPEPGAAGLQAAVDQALTDPALGGAVAVSVVDALTGEPLLQRSADEALVPASTAKVATAVAALVGLPADLRLRTRVVAGATPGEVVLVGGGDPTLAGPATPVRYPQPALLADLVAQARSALGAAVVSRVVVDDSLYTGERLAPGWKPTYVTEGAVAPVTALMVDGGRLRQGRGPRTTEPALDAGRAFAALLQPGAAVEVVRGTATAGAAPLAEVASAPVPQLVERMLVASDNDLAEALARQLALASGRPASFAGAAEAMAEVLAEPLAAAGVGPDAVRLVDGSGLSRDDRAEPRAVTALLAAAVSGDDPRLAPVLSGLPVGGFDGTLAPRYRAGAALPAAGRVRAKTGTLNAVSALAGLLRTADGQLLAFDLTANAVPLGANRRAERALDALAARLAACGCP
jgi:D-alanyl-D-alanine carboxypeptidase/D-alanyl-D-alanine-endopeptidase (penicillin-binding protein 4)